MWCTSEEDYVTCAGKKCGSTLVLTPPGIEVCEVKPATGTPQPPAEPCPPTKPPTKPLPPPSAGCKKICRDNVKPDRDCMVCYSLLILQNG